MSTQTPPNPDLPAAAPPGPPELELIAYPVGRPSAVSIVAATARRDWMNETPAHFANRCLPLLIANQAGWFVLNGEEIRATWDGSPAVEGLQIERDGAPPYATRSHFGSGILTWRIPYLFRTPPGYNLLARGPANWPKDGVYPLEGLVETDWAVSTFTMNWKLTRPGLTVHFAIGEPICMIVPQRRGELESVRPWLMDLTAEDDLGRGYRTWQRSRRSFLRDPSRPDHQDAERATESPWQKHYFRGVVEGGAPPPEHQRRLDLRPFVKCDRLFLEIEAKVREIFGSVSFPIASFDELAETLGGMQATVDFRGNAIGVKSLGKLIAAEQFPILSEEDLRSKIRALLGH